MPKNSSSNHRRAERGNVLILTAVTLVLLLGITALAIDLGYLLNGKAELQNALDAAALAAVSQTHVVINTLKPGVNYDQERLKLIVKYAQKFAQLNEVRRDSANGNNQINLDGHTGSNPNIDFSGRETEPPNTSIVINSQVELPTFFARIFSFNNVTVSATSRANLVPVDGGTGLISGGAVKINASGYGDVVSGGWRPLLIPDSYFDAGGTVQRLIVESYFENGLTKLRIRPPTDGSYYRSRFADNSPSCPFVDLWQESAPAIPGTPPPDIVTSLRDVFYGSDSLNNIMGLKLTPALRGRYNPDSANNPSYKKADYRIVDFATSHSQSGLPSAGELAYYGYNGRVRVGDVMTVLPIDQDGGVYNRMRDLRADAVTTPIDGSTTGALDKFGYLTTICNGCRFTTPNTHPLIIPVLFCNPFEFYRKTELQLSSNCGGGNLNQFTITNIGALFIDTAGIDGDIFGRFVREMVGGGTQVVPGSIPSAQLHLLPTSARLVRQ